jgi:hypothetical protein
MLPDWPNFRLLADDLLWAFLNKEIAKLSAFSTE